MKGIFEKIKKHKKKIIIAVIILALFLFMRSCMSGASQSYATASFIEETVQARDLTISVSGSGTLSAENSRVIMAGVTGDVVATHFSEGDKVKAGDIILEIDTTDANRAIKSAEESLIQAGIAVNQAEISLSNAQLSAGSASESAADLYISSNFAGQVTKLEFVVGDSINTGAIAATVTDNKTALLKLPFHSDDANGISAGQSAVISITSTGETLQGTVREVSGVEIVGVGGILTRKVTIETQNPGGITESTYATAKVGSAACASGGSFEYNVSKAIISTASGKVAALNVAEGDWVTVGQTIMTVSNSSISNQAINAGNSYQAAQLSLENAQLSYESAQRNLDKTMEILDDYVVKAPISGTIASIGFEQGDNITEANRSSYPLLIIYDMDSLEFVMYVDELDIGKVKPGQKVSITADAADGEEFEGVVEKVSINGQLGSGVTTYPVTIRMTDFGTLLPGMNVSADILVEEVEGALSIPVSAVTRGNTVLVVDANSAGDENDNVPAGYRRVTVTLGKNDEDYIEVLAGLEDGDVIAIDTSTKSMMMMMATGG